MTPTMTPADRNVEQAVGGLDVRTEGLAVNHGSVQAVVDADIEWGAGRIHGLLGRNGAGKTTLLSAVASLLPPNSGRVVVDGSDPFEDERLMGQVCLVRESGNVVGDENLRWNIGMQELARPSFDSGWALELLDRFHLKPKSKPDKLSRGQRSAFNAVIGLASRAPVTMFDEVHIGMDAPTRQFFTDLLIEDIAERPRTIVLSSHLINEIEHLLETVTILHKGRVILNAEADDVRSRGVTITGPAARVDEVCRPLTVVGTRDLGPTRQVTAYGDLPDDALQAAERSGLTIGAAPLQELFIHLTEETP